MSDPNLSMGFFLGYGCHQLDMTLYLVGSRVHTVIARFGNYWANSPIENCGTLFLDFESGAYSTFTEMCSMPNELKAWPPFPDYHEANEIVGERGLMILRPYQKPCSAPATRGRPSASWPRRMPIRSSRSSAKRPKPSPTPSRTALSRPSPPPKAAIASR